jgi:DNA-binding SARP family transcriptional activator
MKSERLGLFLLGKPRLERGGEAVPGPRGKKVWALLAYLLRADTAPTRERLAALLFGDADDPLGALRWNLAELRRMLGDPQAVRGEPIELALGPGTFVDIRAVTTGTWVDAVRVPGLGLDLLEGMTFGTSPAFDAWLLTERRHLAAASANVLREAVLARLGDDPVGAVPLARRLVELDPLDEESQAFLVRSLAGSGDRVGARKQVDACRRLFKRELGVEPGPHVAAAAEINEGVSNAGLLGGSAAAKAQLEAGQAAIGAGAVEAGIDCLRRAIAAASQAGDAAVQAHALLALGSALIHSVRAHDDDGATALHQALALARENDLDAVAASAYTELAHVEMLRARYERAEHWLSLALEAGHTGGAERAMALLTLGSCFSDVGRYEEALDMLEDAVNEAAAAEAPRPHAFALSFVARARLMRGELDDARTAAHRSLDLARSDGWTSFVPWPETFVAEIAMLDGDVVAAREGFEHAFALGCQLGDPCWEGMAARGLGLLDARAGNIPAAIDRLDDARTRCVRLPDAYLWIQGYTGDALCALAVTEGLPQARVWIDDLDSLAGRTGMREFVARAYLYRSRLGDPGVLDAAALIAADVQNPALAEQLETERSAVA